MFGSFASQKKKMIIDYVCEVNMELGKQIKKYRIENELSQEDLANKIYVTRQSISNWENDKTYPDVNSLVLLSEIFQVSIDELIKGDLNKMKETIKKEEILKFNQYGLIFSVLLIVSIVSILPLTMLLGYYGLIPWIFIYSVTMFYAFKVEKLKKQHDIQTYKEIVAFSEGKKLDEIEKQREIGKRPYQKFLLVLTTAFITILVCILISILMHVVLN